MDPFTLLYVFYATKLAIQATIYFIWQGDSSSGTISYFYAGALALAAVPLFHVISHVTCKKPLSGLAFGAYAIPSLLAAVLLFRPSKQHQQRVLLFALTTACDNLALLIFLFDKLWVWRTAGVRYRATNTEDAPENIQVSRNLRTDSRAGTMQPKTVQDGVPGVEPVQHGSPPEVDRHRHEMPEIASDRAPGALGPSSAGLHSRSEGFGPPLTTASEYRAGGGLDFGLRGPDEVLAPQAVEARGVVDMANIHPLHRAQYARAQEGIAYPALSYFNTPSPPSDGFHSPTLSEHTVIPAKKENFI